MAHRWKAFARVLVMVVVESGCSRVDVYAITGDGIAGDGSDDQSGSPVNCPSPTRAAGDTSETVQVGSQARTYILHIPQSYDGAKPVPLIVDFHGIGGSGSNELEISPYPPTTDSQGVIMAFPDGLKGPAGTAWNLGPCCVANVDDVAFARALVLEVEKTTCVDRSRIYAVGVLTGGGMAYYLACRAADLFAAVAPAAFDLLQENLGDCAPAAPITVVSFRGTADPRVPYDGGASSLVAGMPITFLGAEMTFQKWSEIDGCSGSPSTEDSSGCSSYSGCQNGVEVILCTKQGGGDDPGNPSVAWPVLERHTR
jgi:polyhydroxybutyrate depolymerase